MYVIRIKDFGMWWWTSGHGSVEQVIPLKRGLKRRAEMPVPVAAFRKHTQVDVEKDDVQKRWPSYQAYSTCHKVTDSVRLKKKNVQEKLLRQLTRCFTRKTNEKKVEERGLRMTSRRLRELPTSPTPFWHRRTKWRRGQQTWRRTSRPKMLRSGLARTTTWQWTA